ncbi:MAG: hypothetical protein EPO21_13120 [Chloroflexota bacterium]|nr:MAG: hypothetical protein EPO21_13120 [Chloroflexota bacterium]
MTRDEACAEARSILAGMDGSWASASCEALAAHVCSNSTLFVGNDPRRVALCGGATTPTPVRATGPRPTTGLNLGGIDQNTLLIFGGALLIVLLLRK